MRLRLWQRVFIHSILLVVVSQALAFFLFSSLRRNDMDQFLAGSARAMAAELAGNNLDMTLAHMRLYSGTPHTLWLLNADGSTVSKGRLHQAPLPEGKAVREWTDGDVTLIETDRNPRIRTMTPLELEEGRYRLLIAVGPPPQPMRAGPLVHMLAAVFLVSVTLALWMAWRVSRPLRRLHDEVREMSRIGPGVAVTVSGNDEIADLAAAVNSLAKDLARHVQGMRDLVINVSHELRSPLARANVALGIVEESLPPEYTGHLAGAREESERRPPGKEEMVSRYLASLQEELTHMDSLIGTTLLTQKLATQRDSVLLEHVDFSALCEEVCEKYLPFMERHAFRFERTVAPGMAVRGNKLLLMQLLSNLLDNCLKYTDDRGEIRLTLRQRQEFCVLCLENSHEPLDHAKLDHIFDPFYRMDQATGTGVGLGLSLVQKTAELHGGNVMAVPTDIGVCMCVQLPLETCGG